MAELTYFNYKCKRCGAREKYPCGTYLRKEKGMQKFHTMGLPPGWSEYNSGREYELEYYVLCPDCTKEFHKFMGMEEAEDGK